MRSVGCICEKRIHFAGILGMIVWVRLQTVIVNLSTLSLRLCCIWNSNLHHNALV